MTENPQDAGIRNFDAAAATWDANPQRVRMAQEIFDAIAARVELKPGLRVLDFGCGTGLLTLRIGERTGSVTGADTSEGMLEKLLEKSRAAGASGVAVLHLKSQDGSGLTGEYDLIASSMTFHHVRDVAALTARLAERLRPGGCLCVADLDPEGGRFHADNAGVFHFGFSRDELERIFREAGLAGVQADTVSRVLRSSAAGTEEFTIFLMVGRKPLLPNP